MAAYYGFFRWSGFGPATDFIGLQNYVTIFSDPIFQQALGHNAFIVVALARCSRARSRSCWRCCSTAGCAVSP